MNEPQESISELKQFYLERMGEAYQARDWETHSHWLRALNKIEKIERRMT